MGRDSRMLLDMGTWGLTLQGSGGSSRHGCCTAGLSHSSVLQGWLWDRDWAAGAWGSGTGGATGDVTGAASSDILANSIEKKKVWSAPT